MKLIFALGNPGTQYANTRHNVGWFIIDRYAQSRGTEFQFKKKFMAGIADVNIDNQKIILAKPTTFYNEVGISAQAIASFYGISPEDILIIHDDLAIDFGRLRIRNGGSDAGNNGIKSINSTLGNGTWRLRVGTKNDKLGQIENSSFVLAKFTKDETNKLTTEVCDLSSEYINKFIGGELTADSSSVAN